MEKLLKKYNEECNITSKLANTIWKISNIIELTISFFCIMFGKILIGILSLLGFNLLFAICILLDVKHIKKKLGLKEIILIKNRREDSNKLTIYQELDRFQKNWITDYCKANKLNSIKKLEILKNEIRQKRESGVIKYLNPVIIGTLLIVVWEKGIEELLKHLELIYIVLPLILLSIIISLILGYLHKEYKDQRQFMNLFGSYSGYERLEQLLIYRILKCNK